MLTSVIFERHGFVYTSTNRWTKPGGAGVVAMGKDGLWHSSLLGTSGELEDILNQIEHTMEQRRDSLHDVLNKLSLAANVSVDQLVGSWGTHLPLRGQDPVTCKQYISRLCAGTGIYNKVAAYVGAR